MDHHKRHLQVFLFGILGVCLLSACSKEPGIETRHFRMGLAVTTPRMTGDLEMTYARLAHQTEIVNHHLDAGVPWQESLDGTAYDPNVLADWNFRKSLVMAGQKIYVSVTPLNASRNGLASYRAAEENMALPPPWNSYSFSSRQVKEAYLNYCRRVIEFFHPDYFAMSAEANLFHLFRPQEWTSYLALHQFVYTELKRLYPDLPVFSSLSGAPMLNGFIKDNDHVQQRLAAMQVLAFSDYFALSLYPPETLPVKPYPENAFDELFSLSGKPLVVAQTGYGAETFSMSLGKNFSSLQGDQASQQKFFDGLLHACEKWKAEFVICFTADYRQFLARQNRLPRVQLPVETTGLYYESESADPLNPWGNWLRRKVVQ
jgi:hypothetical protein